MKRYTITIAGLVIAIVLVMVQPVRALAFTVNSTGDAEDVSQGDGVCETWTPGECTFRAAIMEANASPGTDTISFNIPGEGPHTISPSYGLDFIFDPIIIDGTTQPGFSGIPIIELDGSQAGPDAYGIVIHAGSSTVRGLVINRFALTGIDLDVNGDNIIQGNYIGTDLTGTVDLGNGANGVAISQGSSGNLIGGTANGAGNVIAFNSVNGIVLAGDAGTRNAISSNSIHSNGDLGIDLGWDGVTLYDLFDLDSGANNLQNSPVLTMVKNTGKGTVVQGVLVSRANTDFSLEFFNGESCDPSGYGEGQTYLGSVQLRTNTIGRASFRITLPTSFAADGFVTATATDSANNTSEYSNCMMVSP
jgi:CSLREA domain-containing protein